MILILLISRFFVLLIVFLGVFVLLMMMAMAFVGRLCVCCVVEVFQGHLFLFCHARSSGRSVIVPLPSTLNTPRAHATVFSISGESPAWPGANGEEWSYSCEKQPSIDLELSFPNRTPLPMD